MTRTADRPGLHLVQYPLRSGRMYNQVAVFRSPSFLTGDPDYGNPQELKEAFAGCSEHVRESLGTLSIDNRWPMLDRPHLLVAGLRAHTGCAHRAGWRTRPRSCRKSGSRALRPVKAVRRSH